MGKPISKIEESLSIAYASAVIAYTGHGIDIITEDYGVDISVRKISNYENQFIDVGPLFDCQLKATINWVEDDKYIIYDMKSDAYNRLIFQNEQNSYRYYLILLCLPREKENWIEITNEELLLRKCCYYYYLEGEKTDNKEQIRIKIPIDNKFCPEKVLEIIYDIEVGTES